MAETVDSYGAKTHLQQILRQVQAGKEFEKSVRGVAVAKLIAVESVHQQRIGPIVSSKATTDTGFPRACGDSPV